MWLALARWIRNACVVDIECLLTKTITFLLRYLCTRDDMVLRNRLHILRCGLYQWIYNLCTRNCNSKYNTTPKPPNGLWWYNIYYSTKKICEKVRKYNHIHYLMFRLGITKSNSTSQVAPSRGAIVESGVCFEQNISYTRRQPQHWVSVVNCDGSHVLWATYWPFDMDTQSISLRHAVALSVSTNQIGCNQYSEWMCIRMATLAI